MATICQQCGAEGFSNAFVYCVNCLHYAIHRYCLETLPRTTDEFVRWFCEDCKPGLPDEDTRTKDRSFQLLRVGSRSPMHGKSIRPRRKLKKTWDVACLVAGAKDDVCREDTTESDQDRIPSANASSGVETEKGKSRKRKNTALVVETDEEDNHNNGIAEPHRECSPSADPPLKDLKKDKSRKKSSAACRKAEPSKHPHSDEETKEPDKESVASVDSENLEPRKEKLGKRKKTARLVVETDEASCHGAIAEPDRKCIPLAGTPLSYTACRKKDSNDHSRNDATELTVKLKETEKRRKQKDMASPIKDKDEHSQNDTDKMQDSSDYAKFVSDNPLMSMNPEKNMKNNMGVVTETEVQMNINQELNEDRRLVPFCNENNIKDLELEKQQRLKISNASEYGNDVPHSVIHAYDAKPLIDPVWRGTFNIPPEYEMFEGLVGHLSDKACCKVCEEADMLPTLICFEILPKTLLWPKSFQECQPSGDNIALYFFPADAEQERMYDYLVLEMLNKNLALRSIGNNAELLIFTSKELPRLYWRFQGKYYLWGVFRAKRSDSTPPADNRVVVNSAESRVIGRETS